MQGLGPLALQLQYVQSPQTSHHKGGESGRRAVSASRPSGVISSVCSNCAERLPSAVVAVQSSDQ
eukprot:scaffold35761_cov56-Phaeocystis_antarctica.AAC.3